MGLSTDNPKRVAIVCEYLEDGCVLDKMNEPGYRFSKLDKYNILRQTAAGILYT